MTVHDALGTGRAGPNLKTPRTSRLDGVFIVQSYGEVSSNPIQIQDATEYLRSHNRTICKVQGLDRDLAMHLVEGFAQS